jgi:conjugal transfer ATP-binding protein TraC
MSGLGVKVFPLADELSQWELEEGVVFTRDGKMEVGFELTLPQMLLFSDEDLEDFHRKFSYFLRLGVPEGERFRLLIEVRQEAEGYLESIRKERGSYVHPLGELFFEERMRLFESLAARGILRTWRYYGFLTLTPPRGKVRGMFSEREYEEALALAQAVRDDFMVRLASMGIKAQAADDQRLFETMWRWFNPDRPAPRYVPPKERVPYGTPDYEGLTAQLAKTAVDNAYSTRILVGETWISGRAMGVSPDMTWTGFVDALLKMEGEFYLVLDWYHRDTASEMRKLSATLRTATAMTKADTVVDPGVFVKAENYSEALKRVQGEGRHLFDVSAYLIFLSKDERELVRRMQESRGRFAELGGVRGLEIHDFFEAWVSVSPGSGRTPYYKAKLLEDNAADFMPTWSPWRGMSHPIAVYEGQGGVTVQIDPFSSEFPAKHGIVVGGSGRGKSFFVQSFLNQLALRGVEIIIVDRGFNYVTLVELLGGSVVVMDPVEGTSVNPFELREGELLPSEEKKDLIRAVFRAMVPPPSDEQESSIEEAIFMAAVEQTYLMQQQEDRHGNRYLEPFTLSTVVSKLRNMEQVGGKPMGPKEKDIATRLAYALDAWTGDSVYGRLIDRPSNVNLDNQVVYFETGRLGNDGPLTQVGLLLISDLIWKKITKKPGPKLIVLDEAWALLKTQYGAAVVENLYRRSRTFGAAVYAVTQSLQDFTSGYAQGILENTYFHYIFPAPNQEENIRKLFGIPQRVMEKVYKKLEFRKGEYSEVLVVLRSGTGLVGGVLRNRVTPLEYWAYTTDQNDKAKRARAVEKYGNLKDAIVALARGEVV